MKYIFLVFILLSCNSQVKQERTPISQKRQRPVQNNLILNHLNSEEGQKALERIKQIEIDIQKQNMANSNLMRKKEEKTTVSNQDYPTIKPQTVLDNAVATKEESQILEITGTQKKTNPHKPEREDITGKFIVSTSASYQGVDLEEARQTLEKFGEVKVIKFGEKFAIKVYPKNGLNSEDDAKKFMEKIISSSFFDVFIEKAN